MGGEVLDVAVHEAGTIDLCAVVCLNVVPFHDRHIIKYFKLSPLTKKSGNIIPNLVYLH